MEDLPRGVSLSESDSDDSTIPPPDLDFETYVDVVSVVFLNCVTWSWSPCLNHIDNPSLLTAVSFSNCRVNYANLV